MHRDNDNDEIAFAGSSPQIRIRAGGPQLPSFEVATIKLNKSLEPGTNYQILPDKFTMRNATLRAIIMIAYHIRAAAIIGGPGWIDSDRFEIDAKTAAPVRSGEIRAM